MRRLHHYSGCLRKASRIALGALFVFGSLQTPADAAPAKGGELIGEPPVRSSSPQALLRAGLGDARKIFGVSPDVVSATRSIDGSLTVALFRITQAGTHIGGLILASYVQGAPSRIAIVYDRADRFAATAPALIARATAALPRSASTAAAAGPLRPMTSPDGSVRALFPAGWKPTIFGQGELSAIGPDGAEVDQEVAVRLIDPRSPLLAQEMQLQRETHQPVNPFRNSYGIPLSYEPDPAHAYVAFARTISKAQGLADPDLTLERTIPQPAQPGLTLTEIVGSTTVKGVRMRFDGYVGVSPATQMGAWSLYLKMVSAPVASFTRDLPQLAAVYNSYRVDQGVRGRQVARTIEQDRAGTARGLALMQQTQAQNTATFNASMSHARSVQASIDRSTAGFTRYLDDTTVIQNAAGNHATVNASFADDIVKNDPRNFRVVPMSEYRAGTDFK